MTPVLPIKRSKPGPRRRGEVLHLGKRPDWNSAVTREGEQRAGAARELIMNCRQRPGWTDTRPSWVFMRKCVWFVGKLSLISFARVTLPQTLSNVGVRKTG